jgi:hypothetical protein
MRIEVGFDLGLVPAAEEGVDLEDGQPALLDAILKAYEVVHFVCQLNGVGLDPYHLIVLADPRTFAVVITISQEIRVIFHR